MNIIRCALYKVNQFTIKYYVPTYWYCDHCELNSRNYTNSWKRTIKLSKDIGRFRYWETFFSKLELNNLISYYLLRIAEVNIEY